MPRYDDTYPPRAVPRCPACNAPIDPATGGWLPPDDPLTDADDQGDADQQDDQQGDADPDYAFTPNPDRTENAPLAPNEGDALNRALQIQRSSGEPLGDCLRQAHSEIEQSARAAVDRVRQNASTEMRAFADVFDSSTRRIMATRGCEYGTAAREALASLPRLRRRYGRLQG